MAKIRWFTKGEYYYLEKNDGDWKAIIKVISEKKSNMWDQIYYDIEVINPITNSMNIHWTDFSLSEFKYFNIKHLLAYKALYGL